MRLTPTLTAAALVAAGLAAPAAPAATTTASFGWEDGTSTVLLPSFRLTAADVANVTSGSEFDYGTADVAGSTYDVTPYEGTQMLQATESDTTGSNPGAYLGFVDNLDVGDTITYSFRGYDPTAGRSPSIAANAVYAQNNDFTSFGGYAVPLPPFSEGPGFALLSNTITFGAESYDAGVDTGVVLQASLYAPSASLPANGGPGTYKFFIDDLSVSVTTNNPDATLLLPDGSVISLAPVPEPTSLALLGVGGLALLRRRRA